MKKYLPYIFVLIIFVGFFTPIALLHAQSDTDKGDCTIPGATLKNVTRKFCTDSSGTFLPFGATTSNTPKTTNTTYNLLEPLPCKEGTEPGCKDGSLVAFDPSGAGKLGEYLNIIIRLFIGLCAVAAVVMIVIGGIEYSTSELISTKAAAKDRIQGAILGLLLALGSYAILFTINPDLLKTDVEIGSTTLVSEGELLIKDIEEKVLNENPSNVPFTSVDNPKLEAVGIQCNGGGSPALESISKSFIGKTTYALGAKGVIKNGKLATDCSGYIAQVYACAGLSSPGGSTGVIFSTGNTRSVTSISADGTSVDGIPMRVGDLLGWKQGETRFSRGHVFMYIGNGKMINQTRSAGTIIQNVNQYRNYIKHIKRI